MGADEPSSSASAAAEGGTMVPPEKRKGVDDDPWKWAPILLLSPMPWAIISAVVMAGGQAVINGAEHKCVDPSGNGVDTSSVSSGITMATAPAYLFLCTYTWIWLGHSVHVYVPWRKNKKWFNRKVRVMKPFTKLKTIVIIYTIAAVLSLVSAAMMTAGVMATGSLCHSQTPMLVSFSTFFFVIYWVAAGVTAGRLFTLTQGHRVAAALEKAGVDVDGSDQPKSDVDMVRVIFKQFDHSGDGHMETAELGAFLELLGMTFPPEKLEEVMNAIDKDRGGSITLAEFEAWYVSEAAKPAPADEHHSDDEEGDDEHHSDDSGSHSGSGSDEEE